MSTKNDVLKLLEESRGEAISGNEIAIKLGLSRTSVWKAINSLKNNGYKINSVNKLGYTFLEENDVLSKENIISNINDKDFYSDCQVYSTITSTNDEAKRQATSNKSNGICIISEEQTAGKGRLGRSFHSPVGAGIYMSVILRLDYEIEQSMLITSGVAVAVCKAISTICNLDCDIKWVNDIYYKGKKLCGILTEATVNFETQTLDYIIVGIGINVHKTAFPAELSEIITAISSHTEGVILRNELIAEILNELQIIVENLDKKEFLLEYRKRSCVIGENINVITPKGEYQAKVNDINEHGNLIVTTTDNKQVILNSGEISIRKI